MKEAIKNFAAAALLITLIFGVPASTNAQKKNGKGAVPAPAFGNVNGITAQQLEDYLTFIASDELEGRDTPSRGLDIAAMYIAQHLSRWGLKPAGDNGTYFQKFPLKRSKVDANGTKLELNGQTFNYGDDFLSAYNAGNISGNIVYAGHGWVIKSKNINPYKGIDVKDKIVVASTFMPKGINFGELKEIRATTGFLRATTRRPTEQKQSFSWENLTTWRTGRRPDLRRPLRAV